MSYCHASIFKCRSTNILGGVATIQSAFKSPHGLCGGGLLGFSWGVVHILWADQQNVASVTNSCCCPWLQLGTMDHLTPKALGVGTCIQYCPCKYARLLNFVDLAKRISTLSSAQQLFMKSYLTYAIKIEGETMLVQSVFCLCESACSNGFWSG